MRTHTVSITLWLTAQRDDDLLVVVSLTEVPQADLVKVVQAQTTGDRVQEPGVCDGDGDDLGDIELEEVDVVENAVDVRIANRDENEEGQGDEIESHGHERGVPAGWWHGGCHCDDVRRLVMASRLANWSL